MTSPSYGLFQNKDTIGAWTDVILSSIMASGVVDASVVASASFVAGGTMAHGAACWLVRHLEGQKSTATIMGETYDKHLVLVNSFNGSTGMMAMLCDTRLECLNALFAISKKLSDGNIWKIGHTTNDQLKVDEVAEVFRHFDAYESNMSKRLEDLRRQTLTEDEVRNMLEYIVGARDLSKVDTERKALNLASKVSALVGCYNIHDLDKYGRNKAHVYQAVAMYASHSQPMRKTTKSAEKRLSRLWLPTPETKRAMAILS